MTFSKISTVGSAVGNSSDKGSIGPRFDASIYHYYDASQDCVDGHMRNI